MKKLLIDTPMKTTTSLALASSLTLVALCATAAPRAGAAVTTIMDQIGPSGAFFTGQFAYTSQRESANPQFNIAAVDNFTAPTFFDITNVQAALLGFNGFTSYNNITAYEVNIYSSLATANASLNGDVAHLVLNPASPGAVTLTQPFSGDATSALVSLNVDINLPSAGTFYVSVVADLNFGSGGAVGVYGTKPGPAGSNPGDRNGYQENPGGGFGFTGNQQADNVDFAYRISGNAVPEPSTYALLGVGLGLLGATVARRRGLGQRQAQTA